MIHPYYTTTYMWLLATFFCLTLNKNVVQSFLQHLKNVVKYE